MSGKFIKPSCVFFFLFFIFSLPTLYAQNPILKVAMPRFQPPYTMQSASKQVYGFDVGMMLSLCKAMAYDCQFKVMDFDQLLNALENNEAQVAIGGISITAERAQQVFFSKPYLPSMTRFIGRASKTSNTFGLSMLNNHKIGVEKGSVFSNEILAMGIKNPQIVFFNLEGEMIEALSSERIDFALVDAPSALFWENRSSGLLKALGQPMEYGSGIGIAVQPDNNALLQKINKALATYLKSDTFQKHLRLFIVTF